VGCRQHGDVRVDITTEVANATIALMGSISAGMCVCVAGAFALGTHSGTAFASFM